jgi:DNA-binding NarL/FixJ family response regulator
VLRVLIADQDALVRTLLARLVRRCGYTVVAQASDGDETLEYAASEQPDVVILDLTLPQLNVRRALPTLRAQLPHAHILVLSADAATKQNEPTLRDLGADQYVAKDFAVTRLPIILASLASDPTPRMSGGAARSSATPLSETSASASDAVVNRAP